ncbi:hypothetical protein FQN54_003756, partial [Arachnomyces sp. PD_36]
QSIILQKIHKILFSHLKLLSPTIDVSNQCAKIQRELVSVDGAHQRWQLNDVQFEEEIVRV